MKIRPLTKNDLPQMMLIEESAHFTPWTIDVFERCFSVKYIAWGLEVAEQLVGFIIYSQQVGECHILNLCVHLRYQGQGYGRQLLEHALDQVIKKKVGIAFLEVRRSNTVALSLYQKMGFVEVGIRKGYYPAPQGREDAILLAKDLTVA